MPSRKISRFDPKGVFWERIKKDSLVKQILVITNPVLAYHWYDRFRDKELGNVFVETYKDVEQEKLNEQAYFISAELGRPIERRFCNNF